MVTLIDLEKFLSDLPNKLEPKQQDLQAAGQAQRDRIKERTAKGIGVEGQIFSQYKQTKYQHKSPPVNLRETGNMLDAIDVESTDSESHIFFGNTEQRTIAEFHNSGTKNLPQRHFFGVSLADRDEIVGDIKVAVFKRINE